MTILKKFKKMFKKKKEVKTENPESNKATSDSNEKKSNDHKKKDCGTASRTSNSKPRPRKKEPVKKRKHNPVNNEKKTSSVKLEKSSPRKKTRPFSKMTDLDKSLVKILNSNHFTIPTPVQEKSIPVALKGENVFCSSETGSGKTLSFLLPMLQKLNHKEIDQALVICPTREIAIQTQKVLQMFDSLKHRSALVIGGTDMKEQKKSLLKYPSILVATPGRLLDMLSTGLIWLQYTGFVVLDEADRMLDMGFEEDLVKIHNELTGPHQTLLYSATLFPQVKKMAKRYASNYREVTIGSPRKIAGGVDHILVEVNEKEKFKALKCILYKCKGRAIVFFNTIREVDAITRRLKRQNMTRINCIHSKRDQSTREQLVIDFKRKKIRTLLASDVAARGIDIPNVELIVNYSLPNNSEEYIHRVGRTGRAGKKGKAISFYSNRDRKKLISIEKLIKSKIQRKKDYRNIRI